MGKRSTFMGYLRTRSATATSSGSATGPSVGVVPTYLKMTIADVSAASAATGVIAPKGGRITGAIVVTANGDASTVDIGTSGTSDQFFNELNSNALARSDSADTAVLAADTELYAGTGITAGTGSAVVLIEIVMDDDGVINS